MKIKIDEIEELAKYYKDDIYGKRNAAFDLDDQFDELAFKAKLGLPNEHLKNALVLSTGRDMVDTYTNHTNVTNARVMVNKSNPSKEGTEETKMERLLGQGIIYMTNRDSEISPWWTTARHYWLHGVGVLRTLWIADLWPDKPVRDEGESDESYTARIEKWQEETGKSLPIRISSIHPYNVYPDPDTRETDHIIEINEYHWMKARMFKKFHNPKDRKENDYVTHISYWDREKHCELIDGEPIIKTRTGWDYHGYGFLPYTIFNSGLGKLDKQGDMSKKYVGLLRYVQDLLIAESASFSIYNIVLKKNAWPRIILKGENANLTELKDKFGGADILPDGVEFQEYQHMAPPDQLFSFWAACHDLLAEHGAPRTMKGENDAGVRSGAHQRMMAAEASTRIKHAEQTFPNRTADVLEKCAKLAADVIPGNIRVSARTRDGGVVDDYIKKDKIKPPCYYSVEFAPVSPEDEYRRHDDLERQLAARLIDPKTAREQMSNIDADLVDRRMIKEFWKQHPAILEPLAKVAATKAQQAVVELLGAEAVLAGAAPQLGQNQMGQPPQQQQMGTMNPDMTQRAMPGSAEDLQNKMAQNRSQTPMSPTQGKGGGGARGAYR